MRFPRRYDDSVISPLRYAGFALVRPAFLGPSLRVALTAVRLFFMPQFQNALLRRRPVAGVDHPVDDRIPWDPSTVALYLSFIPLWMNAVYRLHRRYGAAARVGLRDFLACIERLYEDAARVYLRIHTTTRRPARAPSLRCAVIQVMDPHLNCIPSLHVAIVFAAWDCARSVAEAMGDADSPGTVAWLDGLYRHAHRITESTMLMKQHSVNCVGASLWYLSATRPGFDASRCDRVIDELFTIEGREVAVKEEARAAVRAARDLLEADSRAGRPGASWLGPVLRFVESFPRR